MRRVYSTFCETYTHHMWSVRTPHVEHTHHTWSTHTTCGAHTHHIWSTHTSHVECTHTTHGAHTPHMERTHTTRGAYAHHMWSVRTCTPHVERTHTTRGAHTPHVERTQTTRGTYAHHMCSVHTPHVEHMHHTWSAQYSVGLSNVQDMLWTMCTFNLLYISCFPSREVAPLWRFKIITFGIMHATRARGTTWVGGVYSIPLFLPNLQNTHSTCLIRASSGYVYHKLWDIVTISQVEMPPPPFA